MLIPETDLNDTGNWLNDSYTFLSLQQIWGMYKYIILDPDELVVILNKNKNVAVFYATKESIATIPKKILSKIKNKKFVEGLHECFNGVSTSKPFFNSFMTYI